MQKTRVDPWIGKILWRRAWQPTPVFLPEESHRQRRLAGYSPWGHKESDMTEQLTLHYPSKQHWFYKPLIFFCSWVLLEAEADMVLGETAVFLLLMKNKKRRLLNWVGKAFRPWCWPDPCERDEGGERKFGRRTSYQDAHLTHPWPNQWEA